MNTNSTCKYCNADSVPLGMFLVASLVAGNVFVLEDPKHPGRCVVSSKFHVRELFDLTPQQRIVFVGLVNDVAQALAIVTVSDKVNIAFYGDLSDHLHAHIVPKWRGGNEWGDVFVLQPAPLAPTETGKNLGALARKSMPVMAHCLREQLKRTP